MFLIRELVFSLLVPDPCVYHVGYEEEGFFIKNFYCFSASTGYHPEANAINNILTGLFGLCLGLIFYFKFFTHKGEN